MAVRRIPDESSRFWWNHNAGAWLQDDQGRKHLRNQCFEVGDVIGNRPHDHHRDWEPVEILLVLQALVDREQYIESRVCCRFEQHTILESVQPGLRGGRHCMA